jgi:PAS domain S-box-containing protein
VRVALLRLQASPLWVAIPVLAALYVAAGRLGFSMASVATQVTVVWPPTGIALAAVFLLGFRVWPAIFLGALIANVMTSAPLAVAAGIAAGNTLEAVVGAWLLKRAGVAASLTRLRDVLLLVACAALGSTVVSATIGVTSLCLGGVQPWTAFGELWGVWWLGDAVGDLVVAPFLLAWASMPVFRWPRRRVLEALTLLAGVVGVSLAVFVGAYGVWHDGHPLHYTLFPFVILGALRFGQRGATTVTLVASSLAIWSTAIGFGPFASGTVGERLVMVQLFMAVVAVTALLLGAAIAERNAAERRRAKDFARLAAGEQRLRLALEAGQMGVWEWNIRTGAVHWSDNLESLYGLAPASFAGTFEAFQALVHPEDRTLVGEAIARAVELRAGYDVEFRIARPDGGVEWIAGKGQVLCDARGHAERMIGVATNISERKLLDEELRRRARDLADADRRKDEFLAMLAHELRNPLAPLSNALHLLDRGVGDRERVTQIAERQVRHLVRLVEDLLDVSRITLGKISLRKERLLLGDVVARALEMMREPLDARGHQVTVSLPPRPVHLEADGARLAQVIANLLSNAAKFTPPGGSIQVTGETLEDEVVVRVRDTGVGLAPDLRPHVFDLFVQGDASLDRTRGGLGIGLTLVRRLVELHGGRVEARSAGVGEGSEFLVYLPILQPALGEPSEPPAPHAGEGRRTRPLRVLVVEDNTDAAESLALVLRMWGHEVEVAYDGTAALHCGERLTPDVIISDVGLPGMDGYELARRLRRHPTFGGAVLVALSGYARDEDKRSALAAGFDHHFVKPPDLAALAELLGRVRVAAETGRPRTLH